LNPLWVDIYICNLLLFIHRISCISFNRVEMADISDSVSTNLNNGSSIPRRSGNHHGNVWDDDLIQSLNSPYGVYLFHFFLFICFLYGVVYLFLFVSFFICFLYGVVYLFLFVSFLYGVYLFHLCFLYGVYLFHFFLFISFLYIY